MITPALSRGLDPLPTAPTPGRPTPYLALGVAVSRYRALATAFGPGTVHRAIQANPPPALVGALVAVGARFDVASAGEVDLCLAAGAPPAHLLHSNPVKRRAEIEQAYRRGVATFAADSPDEVRKLAGTAPGGDRRPQLVVETLGKAIRYRLRTERDGCSTVGFNGFAPLPTVLT